MTVSAPWVPGLFGRALEQLREVDALGVVAVDPDRQVEEVMDVAEVERHIVRRQQVAVLDAGEAERERLGHHLSVTARGHHQGVDPHRRPGRAPCCCEP